MQSQERDEKLLRKLYNLRELLQTKIIELKERIEEEEFIKGKSDEEVLRYFQQKYLNYYQGMKSTLKDVAVQRNSKRGNKILKCEGKFYYQCKKCISPEFGRFETHQGLGGHCRKGHI